MLSSVFILATLQTSRRIKFKGKDVITLPLNNYPIMLFSDPMSLSVNAFTRSFKALHKVFQAATVNGSISSFLHICD